jgi:hypothetical protein
MRRVSPWSSNAKTIFYYQYLRFVPLHLLKIHVMMKEFRLKPRVTTHQGYLGNSLSRPDTDLLKEQVSWFSRTAGY